MSLDKAAKHLAAHGRGSDTELVHMSKREVKGLQDLAKAHGGSLTINPHTGLAEAGFLEQVLPTVAGIAVGAATGNPMLGAAVAGGLTTAETGSLQQGILAGGMAYVGGDFFGSPATPAPVTDLSTPFVPASTTPTVAPAAAAPTITAPVTASAPASVLPGELGDIPVNASNQLLNSSGQVLNPIAQQTPVADQSWWSKLSNPGKILVGGTGLMTAASLLGNTGNKGLPTTTSSGNMLRLSPNFQGYVPPQPNPYYRSSYPTFASGGIAQDDYAPGGAVEAMSQANQNQFYPQAQQEHTQFATPTQMPTSAEVVDSGYDPRTDAYTGLPMARFASGGDPKKKKATLTSAAKIAMQDPYEASLSGLGNAMYHSQMPGDVAKGLQPTTNLGQLDLAEGGHLGSYSDGGRLLKGPGDGVSDSIPAKIGKHQPARLADGEFVVPARIVSELGNGSTDAGARKLYEMMDKVQASRKKSMGKGKFAVNSKAAKYLPK